MRLKLKDIIKYLDWTAEVKLYIADEDTANESIFCGGVLDIPWIYLEAYLDDREEGSAIFQDSYVNEYNVTIDVFSIYLIELP